MFDGFRLSGLLGAAAPIDAGSISLTEGLLLVALAVLCLAAWRRSSRWRKEADRLRSTLDAIGAPVVVTDEKLTIIDGNQAAAAALGLRRRSARRRQLLDTLTPYLERPADEIVEALKRRGSDVFEARTRREEAGAQQFRVRLRALEGSGGTRVVTILEDISSEHAQAAHYERFLDYLIRNVPVEVSILSPDGRYQYLSSSFLVDEGRQAWLIGKTDFDYCRESGLHTELALRRRAHRMEALDRREAVYFEESVTFNGALRRISWRYVPFAGEDGEVMMVLGFGLDQTELVRCREQLREAEDASAKAERLKEALLQNVSHEIRTPLSGIIGTAQMLRSEIDPALRDFITDVEKNGQRLSRTLNDMLDLAGMEAENVDVHPSIVDLSAEVEAVVRSARTAADRQGLFLEFSASEPEILIRVDRDALGRCIKSLLDNAIKFTSDGGVVVDVSQRDAHAYVRVMDTGVGIGRSLGRDMFEAFRQEQDGIDRAFEGIGLGLAVTERLVRLMGGEIRVHSRKGAGSSFVVRLPLVVPALRTQIRVRPRVLIADPHDEAHRLIIHMMQDLATVESARRLSDLTGLSADARYDVVLAYARMDESRNSSELRDLLRTTPPTAEARLILMDYESQMGRRRLAEEGWDGFVAKPITRVGLLNAFYAGVKLSPAGSGASVH